MAAALVLVLAGLPLCLFLVAYGATASRLVGLEVLGVVATVLILVLARAFGRSPYEDVALVTALVSFAGSLVFARYIGRSL